MVIMRFMFYQTTIRGLSGQHGAYYIKVKFRCLQFHPFLTYKVLI